MPSVCPPYLPAHCPLPPSIPTPTLSEFRRVAESRLKAADGTLRGEKVAGHFPGWDVGSRCVRTPLCAAECLEMFKASTNTHALSDFAPSGLCLMLLLLSMLMLQMIGSQSYPLPPIRGKQWSLAQACILCYRARALAPLPLPSRSALPVPPCALQTACRAYSRSELSCIGFHFPPIAGIDYVAQGKAGKNAPAVSAPVACARVWKWRSLPGAPVDGRHHCMHACFFFVKSNV